MLLGFRSAPATESGAEPNCHKTELRPEPVLLFGKVHGGYRVEGCPFKEREKDTYKEISDILLLDKKKG